jgi:polyisoprenoid-binding protein YceI
VRRRLHPLLLLGLLSAAPMAWPADFAIDTGRSHAEFAVRLLWLHNVKGRFTQIDGTVKLDPQGLATVDARIATDSVTMHSERFRQWMMGPEFFDAGRYPTIHFLSEPVPLTRLTTGGTLAGQLSLRGVSRPVRFELLPEDCRSLATATCKIEARGFISRSAFGMTSHQAALSDHVRLAMMIVLAPAPK